jgi:hypothetical protein
VVVTPVMVPGVVIAGLLVVFRVPAILMMTTVVMLQVMVGVAGTATLSVVHKRRGSCIRILAIGRIERHGSNQDRSQDDGQDKARERTSPRNSCAFHYFDPSHSSAG